MSGLNSLQPSDDDEERTCGTSVSMVDLASLSLVLVVVIGWDTAMSHLVGDTSQGNRHGLLLWYQHKL